MGQRGPQPMPANVHQLRGNKSRKPLAALLDEFRPEVEIPTAPPWIWVEAKREWKRITPELERYGLISLLDRSALVLYCQAWAEYVHFKRKLSDAMAKAERDREAAEARGETWTGGDGFMVPTPNGSTQYSPYWVGAKRAGEEVSKYLAAFGLSPSSRGRVQTSDNRQGSLFGEDGPAGGASVTQITRRIVDVAGGDDG